MIFVERWFIRKSSSVIDIGEELLWYGHECRPIINKVK